MLKELLKDHQTGMSEFQDDYFVTTRAGGTMYGQYKQALRELYKRFRGLRELTCDNEKLQVEIEEQKYLSETETDFKKRYAKIEFKRKSMQMEESERAIKDTKREFKRFYQQAIYLKKQIGDLTDEKRKVLDKDMWLFKVKEMACVDWISKGRLGNSTFEFMNSCPQDMKKQILSSIQDQKKLLEWYETKKEYLIPDKYKQIEMPETFKILVG
jgi:hypothetical protein